MRSSPRSSRGVLRASQLPGEERVEQARGLVLHEPLHPRKREVAQALVTDLVVHPGSGELLGEQTVAVGERGFAAALDWATGLGDARVWALEDCRPVSGAFERFVLVHASASCGSRPG